MSGRKGKQRKGQDVTAGDASVKPLLLKAKQVCHILGDVNERTLARLEERGLIRRVPLLRHKLYAYEDVVKMVEDLQSWKP